MPSYTNQTKSSTTFTNASESAAPTWTNQDETTPSQSQDFEGRYYGFGAFTLTQTEVSVGSPTIWNNQQET